MHYNCRISYVGGLGMSPILKEHIELYKILKFRLNWANTEQDTAIQKLQSLVRNVWVSGQVSGNPYICWYIFNALFETRRVSAYPFIRGLNSSYLLQMDDKYI